MKKQSSTVVMSLIVLASCSGARTLADGVFTIGLECGYAPFNWTTSTETDSTYPIDNSGFLGMFQSYCDGYDVRIADYLATELDYELRIRKVDWDGLIPSLTSGNIDAIIAGMTDTPSRRQTISFSQPYFETRSVMIVLPNSSYASARTTADFAGARVVAQAGTIQNDVIAEFVDSDGWIQATALPSYPDALNALLSGASGIDAILAEEPFAQQMLLQYSNSIRLITIEDETGAANDDFLVTVSVGVRQSDTVLLSRIETALTALSPATRLAWMAEASTSASQI
jgi:ABC-type amino acid transport substrate-binding protein